MKHSSVGREYYMYKVFLVEDEVVVREGIRKNILWEQYGFLYAGDSPDGELALPQIRQIKPDLLITDIKMPFMDGLSLIELVRRELPRTKFVIISGYDDFSYAQKAIRMGVDRYMLKPITKEKMAEILTELHKKMDSEKQQQEYLTRFQDEAKEYETFSRRRLFEQIVTGGLSVSEISEAAKSMEININAPYYNIVLFSLSSAEYNGSTPESYTDTLAVVQNKISQKIGLNQEFILFNWNVTTYAVLIKGSEDDIKHYSKDCISAIKECCSEGGTDISWHIAYGSPVPRLSSIPLCFIEASRILSYRYLCPDEHLLSSTSIQCFEQSDSKSTVQNKKEIDQERIRNFLSNGAIDEIGSFIDQLLKSIGEETASMSLFCRYLAMTIYFAAEEYLASIGCRMDNFWSLELRTNINSASPEEAFKYARQILTQAIELRDSESKKQQRDLLRKALDFINEHYAEETISLDTVARKVNISPNYFSAMFSQEIGQTFVEHLTNRRIDEAKRMLRQTDMRSSEIAFAVGYKDPHYFSFVFKKVSGRTPSEYRKGSRK